jgi:hypothetical protein
MSGVLPSVNTFGVIKGNQYHFVGWNLERELRKMKVRPLEDHRVETSRLPHLLHNSFTGGGEVFGLACHPSFTPRKIPGTHFC